MSAESTKRDLVIVRAFDAPVADAWKAWSDPDCVRQWWGPNGFTCPLARMDVREGGTSLVCMSSPQFGDMYSTWAYTRLVPMERMEYIHNLADSEGNALDPVALGMPPDFPRDQRQTVIFADRGDGTTELTVIEHDWTEGRMMELARMGLEQCLDKMAVMFAEA